MSAFGCLGGSRKPSKRLVYIRESIIEGLYLSIISRLLLVVEYCYAKGYYEKRFFSNNFERFIKEIRYDDPKGISRHIRNIRYRRDHEDSQSGLSQLPLRQGTFGKRTLKRYFHKDCNTVFRVSVTWFWTKFSAVTKSPYKIHSSRFLLPPFCVWPGLLQSEPPAFSVERISVFY